MISSNQLTKAQTVPLEQIQSQEALKPKKKHAKKGTSKGKGQKAKRMRIQSPNGKTLSTESGSSGGGVLALCLDGSSGSRAKDSDKAQRRSSQRNDDSMKKQVRENLTMLENKTAHINLLGKRFKIEDELLGFGSFGRTYLGQDIKKNKDVAIKIMLRKKAMDSFLREATVLKCVNYIKASGFPQMLMSAYNEDICILVEELLGINLETLRKRYTRLSFATVCSIGIQLLNRLESLHKCGFIHRDIKPQNVLLGSDSNHRSSSKVYLIDFGLSISYMDENGRHYSTKDSANSTVVGTALFASINAHQGKDLSRRDDIESLIYTLLYLCAGSVPWKNINIKKKKDRHQIIMFLKEEISSNPEFQENQDVPLEIFQMLQYTQQLRFEEEPDYKYLKSLLQKIIKKNYTSIKHITDIDILNNNFEEMRKTPSPKGSLEGGDLNGEEEKGAQLNALIDVSQIAYQIGLPQIEGLTDQMQSVASNEQLVFKSELEGRTNELRDEISHKLNPAMYRSIFGVPLADENQAAGKFGQMIHEIPEEEEESGSYGDEDDESGEVSKEEDEESKGHSSNSQSKHQSDDLGGDQDCEEEGADFDIGEEDIPDDFEVNAQISSYSLKANDFSLRDKKGSNISFSRQ